MAAAATLLASCANLPVRGAAMPAPHNDEDIVHLSAGGEVRGIIVESIPGVSVSIRSRDDRLLVLQQSEILGVERRSPFGEAAGMPAVRVPDSALAGRWVRIDAAGAGTYEGRVAQVSAQTVVVRVAERFSTATLLRGQVRTAVVSTSRSRHTVEGLAIGGLLSAGLSALLVSALPHDKGVVPKVALAAGAVGAAIGAGVGSVSVNHTGWRLLDLKPASSASPLRARLEREGQPIGANDLIIAARTIAGGFTLVTDDREFTRLPELATENWRR